MEKHYKVSDQTRRAMCAALRGLMAEKPLEKITITEIMDACGMRRQHFYYYFSDIYELVFWMFDEEAVSLLRRQESLLLWQEGLLQLFEYLSENRAVCLCALNSLGRGYLKRFFETDISAIASNVVRHVVREHQFPSNDASEELIARFLAIAMAGIIESWLRGELQQTPEELIRMFDVMFQDYIRGVTLRLKSGASADEEKGRSEP